MPRKEFFLNKFGFPKKLFSKDSILSFKIWFPKRILLRSLILIRMLSIFGSYYKNQIPFCGYKISCLLMFSFMVFQGAKSSFLWENFLSEKPSRKVLNWVIYIDIIGIVLNPIFSLFRSIQSKVFFYSPLSSVRLECVQVLGDFGHSVWLVLKWRLFTCL